MRIVGHIEDPDMKITLFKMDNKFSVKFERGVLEQTYKFREGNLIRSVADLRQLVDESFKAGVKRILQEMEQLAGQSLDRIVREDDSEFDEII